jgi:hypothetical protein
MKCPKFKCNKVSVSFSACRWSSVVLSSKEGRKKRVWRQLCEWLSEAAAHWPAAVSLMLLEALFMQISWVRWHCISFLRPVCLFTVHVGIGPSPLSCGVFLLPPLLQAFPLLVSGHVLPLLPSLAGLFVYSSMRDCPSPPLWHSGCLALFATCFFCCCYCILFFFFLFSLCGGRSVQGLCWSISGLSVGVPCAA